MALLKVDSARAAYPQCTILHASFIVPSSTVANQQIVSTLQALGPLGTAAGQVSASVNPYGVRVPVFANPYPGQPVPATNTSALPRALFAGVITPLGAEYVADLGGFPADIVCVQLDMCRQSRNNVGFFMQATNIDTVNKLLHMQCCSLSSGAAASAPAGTVISFQVTFKDSLGV